MSTITEANPWLVHLKQFGMRVITEELGGDNYPASARSIAQALDTISALEDALCDAKRQLHEQAYMGADTDWIDDLLEKLRTGE